MDQLPKLVGEATNAVFETMIGLSPQVGIPRWLKEPAPPTDLVGIIGLAGRWTGGLSFHVSRGLAERILAGMLGLGMGEEVSLEEVRDAIGEVTNMIAGQVKSRLPEGDGIALSLPSVIAGTDFLLQPPAEPPTLLTPFSFEGIAFYVSVTLRKTDGQSHLFQRSDR